MKIILNYRRFKQAFKVDLDTLLEKHSITAEEVHKIVDQDILMVDTIRPEGKFYTKVIGALYDTYEPTRLTEKTIIELDIELIVDKLK